jgi:negative regulator of sigma E activity
MTYAECSGLDPERAAAMSDILNEQLSALIDGELPAAETALLMRRLAGEAVLRERLARYCLCGQALRGVRARARADFALKVSAALAAEPGHAPAAPARRALRRYLAPLAGLAVAATVAGAAILVLGRSPALDGRPAGLAAVAPHAAAPAAPVVPAAPLAVRRTPEPAAFAALTAGAEPDSYVTPAARQNLGMIPRAELANYVVAHSEVSAPLGLRSVLTNLVADEPIPGAAPP